MEQWKEKIEAYVRGMSLCDMALVKVCLLAAGVLWGIAIPKRCRKAVAFTAMGIFVITYVLAMTPFLKTLKEN